MITPGGIDNQRGRRMHRGHREVAKVVVIVALGVGLMALPWTVLAATFLDVGPSNPFYSYIEDLYHAYPSLRAAVAATTAQTHS